MVDSLSASVMEELSPVDPYGTNPGPIDDSVLYDQEKHVSSAVWDGQERGALRCHEHTSKLDQWTLTEEQVELVERAGFGYLRLIPAISLDNPLISALVERWRRETNTFHLNVGEMTVTLKDVALLLGLSIDGDPVMGVTYTTCNSVCERYLRKTPESSYTSGGMVKLSWLKEYFSQCPENAPREVIECHTRAYLLYLVGSTIFSTTTGNKVPVMYLPLFEDFDQSGRYAWGAAALAFLYRALGNASLKSQSTISGCLTLLQCWSYFHLNIGRPRLNQDAMHDRFPFVLSWKGKQSGPTTNRDVIFYRKVLDSLKECDVEWRPYRHLISNVIPKEIQNNLFVQRSKTMLICFDKAERHLPDRCLRQFGVSQSIPDDVERWERKSRGVDGGVDLSAKMESELNDWLERQFHIVPPDDDADESEYMQWYLRITRKFVGRPISLSSEFERTNAGLRDIAHIADTISTRGLEPEQVELISRIRYIAYECLRDQVGPATVSPTTPNEHGKRIRGKERVRRRGAGKRLRKDHLAQYNTASEDDQLHFSGSTVVVDRLQSYNAHRREDHLPLYPVENEVSALHMMDGDDDIGFDQSELVQVTGEEGNTEVRHAVVKVDESHLYEATQNINDTQLCNSMNEVKNFQVFDSTKVVDPQICSAAKVIDSQELCDAPEEVMNTQLYDADEVDGSQVCDATQEVTDPHLPTTSENVDDSELPELAGESDRHTATMEAEIPESSPETPQDIANQSNFSVVV